MTSLWALKLQPCSTVPVTTAPTLTLPDATDPALINIYLNKQTQNFTNEQTQ